MSWIKMRDNLDTDPDVLGIAAAIDLDELAVIGRLWKLWSWADQHSIDGNAVRVTEATLDRMASRPGFAAAMREVGWLEGRDGSLTFPRFDHHNGQSAKKRAANQSRQSSFRNARSVTQTLPLSSTLISSESEKKKEKSRAGSLDEVTAFCREIGLPRSDAEWFWHKCEGIGWSNGGKLILDWRQTLRSWKAGGYVPSIKNPRKGVPPPAEKKPTKAQPDGWGEWLEKCHPGALQKDFWRVPDSVRDEFRQRTRKNQSSAILA